jgi:hypothetical protein
VGAVVLVRIILGEFRNRELDAIHAKLADLKELLIRIQERTERGS